MIKKNFTIGSDPEFFVSDGNRIVPSYEFLPGTKAEPFELGNGYAVQRDNTLVEGNIPPANSNEEFQHNMLKLMELIKENWLGDMELMHEDSAEYNKEDLRHPEALEFGCEPYIDAWSKSMKIPVGLEKELKRPAGFHIHLGYELDTDFISKREMDLVLTRAFDIIAMTEFSSEHPDSFRDKYYGGFGKFRQTSYGVEFRSLGSYWSHPNRIQRIYPKVAQIVEFCSDYNNVEKILKYHKRKSIDLTQLNDMRKDLGITNRVEKEVITV